MPTKGCVGCMSNYAYTVREQMLALPDEDRVEFLQMLGFCLTCGSDTAGKPCTCTKDE